MSSSRDTMFELVDALRSLLECTSSTPEATVQRRINKFEALRVEVRGTEPAQYRNFCLAFSISPKASACNLAAIEQGAA